MSANTIKIYLNGNKKGCVILDKNTDKEYVVRFEGEEIKPWKRVELPDPKNGPSFAHIRVEKKKTREGAKDKYMMEVIAPRNTIVTPFRE